VTKIAEANRRLTSRFLEKLSTRQEFSHNNKWANKRVLLGKTLMRAGGSNHVLNGIRRAVLLENGGGLSDGQLLEGFVRQRDEAAFEALVRRHGPMVLGVCRRITGHEPDAEDAFQAAFLVLVRRAASIMPRETLTGKRLP
jgi:hypothetical protein